jgi:hypothetical protein
MKCPACSRELTGLTEGGVTVQACKGGCGGLWFEARELQKVDLPSEAAGEPLLHVERDPSLKVDVTKRRNCPKCDLKMMQHFFSVKQLVNIDECPECAGMWLDAGELATIRSEFPTEEARKQAAEKYFQDLFGGQLAEMHAKDEAQTERAQKIAHMFRFICPTYYIPGKQGWGAF